MSGDLVPDRPRTQQHIANYNMFVFFQRVDIQGQAAEGPGVPKDELMKTSGDEGDDKALLLCAGNCRTQTEPGDHVSSHQPLYVVRQERGYAPPRMV